MITDIKSKAKAEEILHLMEKGMTVGQFLDSLVLAQATVLSQVPTYTAIRTLAEDIREKLISHATYLKEKFEKEEDKR